jgi:hypothetical protein
LMPFLQAGCSQAIQKHMSSCIEEVTSVVGLHAPQKMVVLPAATAQRGTARCSLP